ncbi:tat (twin-arginine translocation) pathway signal sequence [Salinisphaera sp. T31B1]|uniref:tat (twin-arginine translocation) pathway signal sequence n=1 Tax=Salinisphaera sp. T31B1 TaxID=727963 RepID=UPI0033401123
MSDYMVSRRAFLRGGGALLTGTLAASSGALALFAPTSSWALELTTLNRHQGQTVLAFTRQVFPHETLDDAVYALVVKDLDREAAVDASLHALLVDGVDRLDGSGQGDWLSRSADEQFVQVKALEPTPFFAKVHSTAVVSLYDNDMAFAHFGYPGRRGDPGYIHRGFNDLHWLPEPPASASGPIPETA